MQRATNRATQRMLDTFKEQATEIIGELQRQPLTVSSLASQKKSANRRPTQPPLRRRCDEPPADQ